MASGCAATAVMNRPSRRDLSIVRPGASRNSVMSELGTPSYTKDLDTGEKIDTFTFDKGVSGGWKFSRAFFHVGADVVTLFLWEIVGWPAEKIASGNNTTIEVAYDASERVKTAQYIKGKP